MPLQQDFGFDLLGLNLKAGVDINATGNLTPSLTLKVGVDNSGTAYIDTSAQNEFRLAASLTIPDSQISAHLGSYDISATDNGSFLAGTLTLDLTDSSDPDQRWTLGESFSVNPTLDLDAQLSLRLEATAAGGLILPSLRADLALASVGQSNLTDWTINLDQLSINLEEAEQVLKPLAEGIQLAARSLSRITQPPSSPQTALNLPRSQCQ